MAKPPGRRPPPEDSAEIADAASFLQNFKPEPEPEARVEPASTADPGEYALLDEPVGEPEAKSPPAPTPRRGPPPPPTERTPIREQAPQPTYQEEDEDVVDRVWNRWGEWGPTILLLAGVAAVWLFLLYITLDADHIGRTFLLFVVGLSALVVCAYPILITLERPVRVTPEQALQDYFDSLNHWLPQYRRMWLLLASPRQDSPPLYDVGALRSYWKERIHKLRTEHQLPTGPLSFTISGYKSEKSAGKSALVAKYTIDVRAGGRTTTPPIASYADSQSLVRGPDRMWYLTKARMPDRPRAAPARGVGNASRPPQGN